MRGFTRSGPGLERRGRGGHTDDAYGVEATAGVSPGLVFEEDEVETGSWGRRGWTLNEWIAFFFLPPPAGFMKRWRWRESHLFLLTRSAARVVPHL